VCESREVSWQLEYKSRGNNEKGGEVLEVRVSESETLSGVNCEKLEIHCVLFGSKWVPKVISVTDTQIPKFDSRSGLQSNLYPLRLRNLSLEASQCIACRTVHRSARQQYEY
jgi:hypothetical protein